MKEGVAMLEYIIGFLVAFTVTVCSIPLVIMFARKYQFVDRPNQRKIHEELVPNIGGLSIFIGSVAGLLLLQPENDYLVSIAVGAVIIMITGLIDDKVDL